MAKFMDDWYVASRREPYHESHTKGRDHSFLGYWSFEAAAVSYVLDIDDTSSAAPDATTSSPPRPRLMAHGALRVARPMPGPAPVTGAHLACQADRPAGADRLDG